VILTSSENSKGNFVKFGSELRCDRQKPRFSACNSSNLRNGATYDHRDFMAD